MYRHNRSVFIISFSLSLVIVAALFSFVLPHLPLFAATNLEDGLVSYWEFEEGSGTETYSEVAGSSRYTGTMVGGVTWDTDVPITSTGSHSMRFDGQQWTVITTTQSPTDLYTMTMSLWFKSEPGNSGKWVSLARTRRTSGTAGRGLMLGMGSVVIGGWGTAGKDKTIYFIVDGHAEVCGIHAPNFIVPDGEWHHIAGVWGAHLGGDMSPNPAIHPNQFRIYIDGNLQQSSDITFGCGKGTPVRDSGAEGAWLTFGDALDHYNSNNTPFGLLDDIRTYDRVLSDEEVFALSGREITGVKIEGKTVGDTFEPYEFNASFIPPDPVTIPFTYTWSATGGFQQESIQNTATITWDSSGIKTVTVTAQSVLGTFTDTHTINVSVPGQRITFNNPRDEGMVYETIPFSATVTPITIATPLDYTWTATGLASQSHNGRTSRTDSASFTWLTPGTKTVRVQATGGPTLGTTVLSQTHIVDIQPVNLQLRLSGPDSSHPVLVSAPFTATLSPATLRTNPVTYTWEATDFDPIINEPETLQLQDEANFTWNTPGTKTITVTVRNEFFSRVRTMTVQVFAVDPEDIITNIPEVVEYGQRYSGLYAATRPISVTRPFTYTWDWSEPSLVTATKPRPFHHVIDANNPLTSSNQVAFTWRPATPLVRDHDTRIVTTTVWSAGGGTYTRTHEIQATYRPLLVNRTGSGAIPDQRIFEDEAITIAFTTIDTDTLGTLTHPTPRSSHTGIVPTNRIVVSDPVQRNTTDPSNLDYRRFDSTVTITPTANRWGTPQITLVSSDDLLQGERSFNLEIVPVNDAPSFSLNRTTLITDEDSGPQVVHHWARDITAGTSEDDVQEVAFSLQIGVEGDHKTSDLFAVLPTLSPTGTLRFTPARHAHGTAIITATLKDDGGLDNPEQNPEDTSEAQTFRIIINPVNDPPVAAPATYTIDENQTLIITDTLLLNRATDIDADPNKPLWYENDAVSLHAVAKPRNGTTALLTNSDVPTQTFQYIRYIPKSYFNGTDTFTYTIRDRPGATAVATITVIINPVNDPPVAANLLFTTNEDTPLVITATQIISRATDPDGDTLILASGALLNETTPPTSMQNGTVEQTASQIRYTPPENFHGIDGFTYMISDGVLTDTARITVTVLSVNDQPSFTAGNSPIPVISRSNPVPVSLPAWAAQIIAGPTDEQETQEISFLLTNNGPTLFTQQPMINGETGDLTFTVLGNHVQGSATVTATLKDDGGTERGGIDSMMHTFEIVITPNRAPVAITRTFETAYKTPLDIPITELGSDPDGDELVFDSVTGLQSAHGSFTLSDDRKTIHFVPADGFSGAAPFSFVISDNDLRDTGVQAVVTVQELRIQYVYLPIVLKRGLPELVVKSISILPDRSQTGYQYTAGEPVTITIEVENIGTGTAPSFWVDLFINPASPPTQPNTNWSTLCTLNPCFGITWGVPDPLEAGKSVVLRSVPGSYAYKVGNGIQLPVWNGWFASGTNNLYVYADSWNNDDPTNGGVIEENEGNNMTNLAISVTGANPPGTSNTAMSSLDRLNQLDTWFLQLPDR